MLPPPEQYRLLIVDDNDMNREILQRHLRRQGYRQITAVEGGQQALDLLREQDFDLILLDVMMPDLSGYDVLARLKGQEKYRSIPVIMISAVEETDSVVRCIELGAEDYLPKPFDPLILKARVGVCLERKFLHDRQKAYLCELEKDALTHPVTQLPSRRALRGYWEAFPASSEITVASLSIDYLGQYRDQLGKAEAMSLLQQVAQFLRQNVAPPWQVFHDWGGEFIVVMPNTPQAQALTWAQTLQEKLMTAHLPHPCSPLAPYVTISMGIVTVAGLIVNPRQLLEQADRELDRAKQSGNSILAKLLPGNNL
ncbi:MAG: response regulator [Pseudanabaenaceae cyanobacterium SKYGB_i_bin29]|nr:response regulator [Pseudanabaenaceae cyanobacterium SKYG29]MDW8422109.1 response regulator [Pseudanabaenaceae cyanobacterium SKYGB_i_bin29]